MEGPNQMSLLKCCKEVNDEEKGVYIYRRLALLAQSGSPFLEECLVREVTTGEGCAYYKRPKLQTELFGLRIGVLVSRVCL